MLSDKTVLVVEDEKPLLAAIKTKLEKLGVNVVTARSVEQALGYIEDIERIDVIWLDHYLLGKDSGLDLVVRLKSEDSKWKSIPVYLISNTASKDKVSAYMQLGVDKYYIKAEHRLDDIVGEIGKTLEE